MLGGFIDGTHTGAITFATATYSGGAQLVFTTHDTNLLGTTVGEPSLKRSQVWLTEKDSEGSTRLYPLTDFKPRKEENLERGYLQGRYGAIPFLGPLADIGKGEIGTGSTR